MVQSTPVPETHKKVTGYRPWIFSLSLICVPKKQTNKKENSSVTESCLALRFIETSYSGLLTQVDKIVRVRLSIDCYSSESVVAGQGIRSTEKNWSYSRLIRLF